MLLYTRYTYVHLLYILFINDCKSFAFRLPTLLTRLSGPYVN